MKRARRAAARIGALLVVLSIGVADADVSASGVWTPTLAVVPQSVTYVDAFRDGSAYVFNTGEGTILKSGDFGLTWTPAPPPPFSSGAGLLRMAGGAVGYGSDRFRIFKTQDGALTWQQVPAPITNGPHVLFGVDAIGTGGDKIVVGGKVFANDGTYATSTTLWASADGGGTWTHADLPYPAIVRDIRLLDGTTGLAWLQKCHIREDQSCLGDSDRILATNDGGASWHTVMDGTAATPLTTAIGLASTTRWVIGRNDGSLLVTDDAGATWAPGARLRVVEPPLLDFRQFWVQGIGFADESVGYASDKGGGTWRTDDGGRTWKLEISPDPVYGVGVGALAVADRDHAVVGGPTFVLSRLPASG
jgi:photosystem II stability/assembly factor-like uncharacterized protein